MLNHSGNIGLVTGANRGIGLEVVHQLAQLGMTLLLGSRDAEKGEQAAKPFVEEGLNVIPVRLDVTDQKTLTP